MSLQDSKLALDMVKLDVDFQSIRKHYGFSIKQIADFMKVPEAILRSLPAQTITIGTAGKIMWWMETHANHYTVKVDPDYYVLKPKTI